MNRRPLCAAVAASVLVWALTGGSGNCQTPALRTDPTAAAVRAADVLQLDLGCDAANVGRLLRLLARDGIRVAWADTGAGGEVTVRVTMPVARFKKIFRGTLAKREVARSAGAGFATELFIERYSIPGKYEGSLRWVRLPDPQIE